ncbi:MAG: hypothetical protein QOG10_4698 [Kribbellaceae bacterium]|nr:hypothetical protein [Kribbellaceae bacterium]
MRPGNDTKVDRFNVEEARRSNLGGGRIWAENNSDPRGGGFK